MPISETRDYLLITVITALLVIVLVSVAWMIYAVLHDVHITANHPIPVPLATTEEGISGLPP